MFFKIKNSVFLPYYYKIWKRQRVVDKRIKKLKSETDLKQKLCDASQIASLLSFTPTGYYSHREVENVFLEAANTIHVSLDSQYERNANLHVMSYVFKVGGLVRAVESWIRRSHQNEKQSLLITWPNGERPPQFLYDAVEEHNGEIILLEGVSILEKATILRQTASKYERVILHTSMDDGTAIVAFGTEEFKRPVILFNHTDYLFWLGVSVADIVANIQYGNMSDERRDIKNSVFLGVPPRVYTERRYEQKKDVRKRLGINENIFVLISTGAEYKYNSVAGDTINKSLEKIVSCSGSICYLIGPSENNVQWKISMAKSNGKIIPLGIISDAKIYQDYLRAADCYIGSYPFLGFTSMMDAVQMGLPKIDLALIKQESDSIDENIWESQCWAKSHAEFENNVIRLINDKEYRNIVLKDSQSWYYNYCDPNLWTVRLENLYQKCPRTHTVHLFNTKKGKQVFIDDNIAIVGFMFDPENFEYARPLLRRLSHYWFSVFK